MQKTIVLFTGENQYTISQEILKRSSAFFTKKPNATLHYYTPFNRDLAEIQQHIYGGGLFSDNKIIILKGVPLDTYKNNQLKADQINELADQILNHPIPEGVILILVSLKPDKRSKLFKAFPTENIKEFPIPRNMIPFIQEYSQKQGFSFQNTQEIETFLALVGTDQFRITAELEKLGTYLASTKLPLTKELIEDIVFPTPEMNHFDFFEYYFQNHTKSYQYLQDMQQKSINEMQVLGMFNRRCKNSIFLIDAQDHGIKDQKILASELKLAPFVLKKRMETLPILHKNRQQIVKILQGIINIEYDIKSGKLPLEYFRIRLKNLLFQF